MGALAPLPRRILRFSVQVVGEVLEQWAVKELAVAVEG
jgi:hypothetical protein